MKICHGFFRLTKRLAVLLLAALSPLATPADSPWNFGLEWCAQIDVEDGMFLKLDGNRLYVVGPRTGVYQVTVIDVTTPTMPQKLGAKSFASSTNHYIRNIDVEDGIVYTSLDEGGVAIINATNPEMIDSISTISLNRATFVSAWKDYLYVAGPGNYTSVYNIDTPSSPTFLYRIPGNSWVIAAENQLLVNRENAYITGPHSYSRITPNPVTLLGSVDGWLLDGSALYGNLGNGTVAILGAGGSEGLSLIDNFGVSAECMAASDGLLFIGSRWGVQVFDPDKAKLPGFLTAAYYFPAYSPDIAVKDNYVFFLYDNVLTVLCYTAPWPIKQDNADGLKFWGPTQLRPGQVANAKVESKNTGTTEWSDARGYKLRVSPVSGAPSIFAPMEPFMPPSIKVAPGGTCNFTVNFTAPQTPGHYRYQFQMLKAFERAFGAQLEVEFVVVQPNANTNWSEYQ